MGVSVSQFSVYWMLDRAKVVEKEFYAVMRLDCYFVRIQVLSSFIIIDWKITSSAFFARKTRRAKERAIT